MGILNKIVNGFIKFGILLLGFSIALVPIIYIFSHQNVSRQDWNSSLEQFQSRANQVEKLKEHTVSNIYLRNDKAKLSWQDVNSTLAFADYLQHQLEEQDITVVKRVLEFKKPVAAKKSKKTEETESINVSQSDSLKQTPPLKWLKEIIEPYLAFQHETIKQKHWIIVCLGELETKVANEIQSIRKNNKLYKFIIVSVWPISSKLIDIEAIPFEEQALSLITQATPKQTEVEAQQPKAEQASEQPKPKKDKKYKVKKVKEEIQKQVPASKSEAQPEL